MSGPRKDLTRYNRAALARFSYVDANAATLLEQLRRDLSAKLHVWPAPLPDTDEPTELLARYRTGRSAVPDWAWEITRAFARATHVLFGHVDAFANERFLRTATQTESLRRLIALVDGRPLPPSSASTPLALEAKGVGVVRAGLAASATPPDGPPIVFETLEDVRVDPAWNVLRPKDFERDPRPLAGAEITLEPTSVLSLGEPLVIEDGAATRRSAHRVVRIEHDPAFLRVTLDPPVPQGLFTRGDALVHAGPKERLAIIGPLADTATFDRILVLLEEPNLAAGDTVVIAAERVIGYFAVQRVDGRALLLDRPVGEISSRARLARALPVSLEAISSTTYHAQAAGDWTRLANTQVAHPSALATLRTVAQLEYRAEAAALEPQLLQHHTALAFDPTGALTGMVWAPASDLARSGLRVDAPIVASAAEGPRLPLSLSSETTPKQIEGGDLVVAVGPAGLAWTRVASLTREARAGARIDATGARWEGENQGVFTAGTTLLFGHFRERVRPFEHARNATPLQSTELELAQPPGALPFGRRLIVESLSEPALSYATSVVQVDGALLRVEHAPPKGMRTDSMQVRANVVLAGHGERRPARSLGSGAGARTSQVLVLADKNVSFVADRAGFGGVRPDVDVIVDDKIWRQVPALELGGPADPIYSAQLDDQGALTVSFGDGEFGRRLPSGDNNVRIRYRVGVGARGNLRSAQLRKLVRAHPLVRAVQQPLAATGGSDAAAVDVVRTKLPAARLAFDRAVSLDDFARLAEGHSGVWQARARVAGVTPRARVLEIAVVPAHGGPLGPLDRALTEFLRARAVPGIEVRVVPYESQYLQLDLRLVVDASAADPEAVLQATSVALATRLGLERRGLGEPLHISLIYAIVQGVPGVLHSVCSMSTEPDPIRASTNELRAASARHVIHLDLSRPGALSIRHVEANT